MSTVTPSGPDRTTFQPAVSFGGTLAATPQPDELFYPLRCDQFLTMCDGEMSELRSARDVCIGAFVTGVFGIASLLLTLDWDSALKQGRHPIFWTILLSVLTVTALLGVALAAMFMHRMRTHSAYSRVIGTVQRHFNLVAVTTAEVD